LFNWVQWGCENWIKKEKRRRDEKLKGQDNVKRLIVVSLEFKSGASVRLRERELDWKNLAPYMRLRYNEENNNIMKDGGRTRERGREN